MRDDTDSSDAPSSLTWVGQQVAGRYEIRRQLAKGAMGRVFLAIQQPLGREVAVKVLETHDDLDEAGAYEERFFREASTLAHLNHPNTVRLYDYGTWNGRLYLVMEYVPGGTLRALLKEEGRLAPRRALRLAKQIASSLAEAHDRGVVHRDLKPSNVLIGVRGTQRRERAKVVDFGLVTEIAADEELTGVGMMLGTPRYMSPEQIRGLDLDGRADLYALGLLLFRMLTGRMPFDQRQTVALLQAHLNESAPDFGLVAPDLELPSAVEWTVRACLEKEPAARFASAYELVAALDACLMILRDPALHDAVLTLDEEGRVQIPFTAESSISMATERSAALAQASAAADRADSEATPRGPPPGVWVALAAGVLAGLLLVVGVAAWFLVPLLLAGVAAPP